MTYDSIRRQDAIDALYGIRVVGGRNSAVRMMRYVEAVRDRLKQLPSTQPQQTCEYWDSESKFCALCRPSAQPEPQWIPFETRPLTEEEKEEHPEWDYILDCKLPDDGQRILVSIRIRGHEEVQQDEFYSDDGSYLDSGYEIGTEAVAWMPLPEPWKGEER